MLTGGCLCGAVRYEAAGAPFDETICHRAMCRRASGAPLVAWFTVGRADFRVTAGAPRAYRSSATAVRAFCPDCGTQLTFAHDDFPDEIDVTTASLDAPERVPPRDHTRTSSRIAWVRLADGLPAFPEGRPAREEG